tara:strand:- start:310 stop:453 length:144 start_codon:yes stop_codon:yes gene_type:complete
MIKINKLKKEKITAKSEAKTGKILNHNWEVLIEESIGRKFVLFFILI